MQYTRIKRAEPSVLPFFKNERKVHGYMKKTALYNLKNKIFPVILVLAVFITAMPYMPASKAYSAQRKGSLITNGNFEYGWEGWDIYFNEQYSGSANITSGFKAEINIDFFLNWYTEAGDQGPVDWSVQLTQKKIKVEKGQEYKLRFTAASTVKRPVAVTITSGGSLQKEHIVLGVEEKEYEINYKASGDYMDLGFMMGQFTKEQFPQMPYTTEEFEKHSIYLSNIKLTGINDTETDKEEPGITGAEDGGKYKIPVSVKVNYKKPYKLELQKDGKIIPYKEGAQITGNGSYILKVTDAEDKTIQKVINFTIDIDIDYSKEWVVISNKCTNMVMEAGGYSGTTLIQGTYKGRASQFFYIEEAGNGYVTLHAMSSEGLAGIGDNGTLKIVETKKPADSQLWKIDSSVPQGYVKFINKETGQAVDVSGASKTEGKLLSMADKSSNNDEGQQNNDAQRWDIIRTIDVKEAVEGSKPDVATQMKWKANAVITPVVNALNPAGQITAEFYPLEGANTYSIYFDGKKEAEVSMEQLKKATVKDNYMLTEDGTIKIFKAAYSTEVKKHTLYIQTDTGVKTDETSFYISKKGLCWGTLHRTQDMDISWYYNWSAEKSAGTDKYLEFVPMLWGNYGNGWLEDTSNKRYGTVLSFNEPDWSDQSNVPVTIKSSIEWTERYNKANGTNIKRPLSVEETWQAFMDSGLRVGSPATAIAPPYCNGSVTMNEIDGPDNWWYDFMDLIKANNSKGWDYDFVAVHCYDASCDAKGFLKMVDDTYKLTGKPIWITEFGVAEWNENKIWKGGNAEAERKITTITIITATIITTITIIIQIMKVIQAIITIQTAILDI